MIAKTMLRRGSPVLAVVLLSMSVRAGELDDLARGLEGTLAKTPGLRGRLILTAPRLDGSTDRLPPCEGGFGEPGCDLTFEYLIRGAGMEMGQREKIPGTDGYDIVTDLYSDRKWTRRISRVRRDGRTGKLVRYADAQGTFSKPRGSVPHPSWISTRPEMLPWNRTLTAVRLVKSVPKGDGLVTYTLEGGGTTMELDVKTGRHPVIVEKRTSASGTSATLTVLEWRTVDEVPIPIHWRSVRMGDPPVRYEGRFVDLRRTTHPIPAEMPWGNGSLVKDAETNLVYEATGGRLVLAQGWGNRSGWRTPAAKWGALGAAILALGGGTLALARRRAKGTVRASPPGP